VQIRQVHGCEQQSSRVLSRFDASIGNLDAHAAQRKGSRMAWPQLITQWLVSDRLAEMSERVAGRSRMAVWQRIVARGATLGPAESRGYIRARAASVVHAETDRLIEQEGPAVGRMRERIIGRATDSLVGTIVAQLAQRRVTYTHRAAA
jgi:hypothetical protein